MGNAVYFRKFLKEQNFRKRKKALQLLNLLRKYNFNLWINFDSIIIKSNAYVIENDITIKNNEKYL